MHKNRMYYFLLLFFGIGFSLFLLPNVLFANEIDDSGNANRKLRFFGLNLHASVIADVKAIFETMGHEVVDWNISGHSWVFGNTIAPVAIVNQQSWVGLDQNMCDQFYEQYKDYLSQFDGFIVAFNSSFALLYEKFDKPIIIVNPTRYECPFTYSPEKWSWLNNFLVERVKNNNMFIVSNNKGDQEYLRYFTGIEHEHIPSLCFYTHCEYSGRRQGYIAHSWSANHFTELMMSNFDQPSLIQNSNFRHPYEWHDLYDYQGIIHFPYQISTMSLFEQYTANVPLFFPTKRFLKELRSTRPDVILSQLSFFKTTPPSLAQDDPNNLLNPDIIDRWIENADYYDEENMPYIQYFDSLAHLEFLLQTTDLQEVSRKMKEYNSVRKQSAIQKWGAILQKIQIQLANQQ